jgi:hypothetical protein
MEAELLFVLLLVSGAVVALTFMGLDLNGRWRMQRARDPVLRAENVNRRLKAL